MEVKITLSRGGYGFAVNWNLLIIDDTGNVKNYWLGQDVKVCSRLLGCEPEYLVRTYENETGKNYNEWNEDFAKWLGWYILEALTPEGIDVETAYKNSDLQSWSLAVE